MYEPDDPHGWHENWLCWQKMTPEIRNNGTLSCSQYCGRPSEGWVGRCAHGVIAEQGALQNRGTGCRHHLLLREGGGGGADRKPPAERADLEPLQPVPERQLQRRPAPELRRDHRAAHLLLRGSAYR
jgi:hypothetical protein